MTPICHCVLSIKDKELERIFMRYFLFLKIISLIILFSARSTLAEGGDYYYAPSYFTKVMTPTLSCPKNGTSSKKSGNIICQAKCRNGFTQVVNSCVPNKKKRKYGKPKTVCTKKIGKLCTKTAAECSNGWEGPVKVAGLVNQCLSSCPSNYKGVEILGVEWCEFNQKKYPVISLKVIPRCETGFSLIGPTCVKECKTGYKQTGNYCTMTKAPKGYAFCGIPHPIVPGGNIKSPGFSKGYKPFFGNNKTKETIENAIGYKYISAKINCQMMLASQVYTVTSLAQALANAGSFGTCATCKAQLEANQTMLVTAYADDLDTAAKAGPEIIKELDDTVLAIQKLVANGDDGAKISRMEILKTVSAAKLNSIIKTASNGASFASKYSGPAMKLPAFYQIATVNDPNSYEGKLQIVRNAATIAALFLSLPSILNETAYPVTDLLAASMDAIATFAYPVYGIK